MAGNLNSTLAQKSRRSEKRNHHHSHHAVLCILFPMNITVDLTLLVSLKWSPCDLLWSLITYRDVSSFSLVYPLLGGWLLGLGVCVCCAASACIHADVCSIITSSLAVKFIIVLKSERVCVCGANRSVPKPIMFKGDGAGIYIDDEEDKLFSVFFFQNGNSIKQNSWFLKMASICILVIIVFHFCTYSGLCYQYTMYT